MKTTYEKTTRSQITKEYNFIVNSFDYPYIGESDSMKEVKKKINKLINNGVIPIILSPYGCENKSILNLVNETIINSNKDYDTLNIRLSKESGIDLYVKNLNFICDNKKSIVYISNIDEIKFHELLFLIKSLKGIKSKLKKKW
ncbi:hypothetical protein [Vibrio sonorensis]|uniref:hypothetical protein n=1 Tax=Vibrio sonorensis TaxID=1004316 RepID=UPI0008D9BEE0|nr:hypothetical protein [Vibrio sonorensis]